MKKKWLHFLLRVRASAAVFFLCVSVFLLSCSKKEEQIPAGIIPKEKMVQVMVDVHLAEARLQMNMAIDNSFVTKQSYYKFIFQKYKISYADLSTSYNYYSAHPEVFSKIYDEVITELSKKQAEASKK